MPRCVRRYWDEEAIWFLFELDPDGWVTRQIELQEPGQTPIAAASLDEWTREDDAGRTSEYEALYGRTAEKPITTEELSEYEEIPSEDFEQSWRHARHALGGD